MIISLGHLQLERYTNLPYTDLIIEALYLCIKCIYPNQPLIFTRSKSMKTVWTTPELTVYGAVEELTNNRKTFGTNDGFILVIPSSNGPVNVPIGDYVS